MTIPAWPTGVPYCPIMDSVQIAQTSEPPLRTEMNAGTTRARRKYSLRIARVGFSLRMTNAQLATWRTFHDTTLGDGSARFTMPILFAGASVTKTVQIVEPPSYSRLGGGFTRVNLSLHVESL